MLSMESGSQPLLELLASLGMPPSEAIALLVQQGAEKLHPLVPQLPRQVSVQMLEQAAHHIGDEPLAVVTSALIEHVHELPAALIEQLSGPKRDSSHQLLQSAKRRILSSAPALFMSETHQQIIDFTSHPPRPDVLGIRARAPAARRARSKPLQILVGLVAGPALYSDLLALLQQIYLKTKEKAVTLLRCDLLMALHELNDEQAPVVKWDRAHRFICCLDAALRETGSTPMHPRSAAIHRESMCICATARTPSLHSLRRRFLRELMGQAAAAGMPRASEFPTVIPRDGKSRCGG